jgi:Arc/MetJ-type ribon-helix-helix transcriptional regulator
MKTKDDRPYKPGMTLWAHSAGSVVEYATTKVTTHLPEMALTVDRGLLSIGGVYATRSEAYREAISYWLRQARVAQENVTKLNEELNRGL